MVKEEEARLNYGWTIQKLEVTNCEELEEAADYWPVRGRIVEDMEHRARGKKIKFEKRIPQLRSFLILTTAHFDIVHIEYFTPHYTIIFEILYSFTLRKQIYGCILFQQAFNFYGHVNKQTKFHINEI